jgi:AraC family transcriptional regulator
MSGFTLETVTAQPFGFVKLEATLPEMTRAIGNGFLQLGGLFGKADARMSGAPYAHYLTFDGGKAVFELGFPVAEAEIDRLRLAGVQIGSTPAGQVLKGIHMGPYETVNQTYESMGADLRQRHLAGTADMWERYYSPPGTPPEKTMTEVIWPISGPLPETGGLEAET